jgi:ATP/maltotriose-dependent transcriptional regulator MalT
MAIARSQEIMTQLQADRHTAALALRPVAHLHAMGGRIDVAHNLLAQSNAMLVDLGASLHSAVAHYDAFVALLAGDAAAAEAVLRTGYEQLEAMGERALLATTAAMLAEALLAQDRDEEAWAFTETGEAAAAPDDLNAHMLCRGVRARLLARQGEIAAADRISAEAVALAAQTDWLSDHADALVARAHVLRAADETSVAIVTVREAVALYERKGNATSAERATSLIEDWA